LNEKFKVIQTAISEMQEDIKILKDSKSDNEELKSPPCTCNNNTNTSNTMTMNACVKHAGMMQNLAKPGTGIIQRRGNIGSFKF
jgi:hypothetical protein